MSFLTIELNESHDKAGFECSQPSLTNYLKLQAKKESKKGFAKVYVLLNANNKIIGYYTLSSSELPKDSIPEDMLRKLPRNYSGYPAILLGRLAITNTEIGKGLGGELIVDAIHRCIIYAESIGTSVIIVDPIDANAANFYAKFMFKKLPDSQRMILKIDHNLRQHFDMV